MRLFSCLEVHSGQSGSQKILDKYEIVNTVRNCLGYSGTYKGKESISSSKWYGTSRVLGSMHMNYTMFIMLGNDLFKDIVVECQQCRL